MKKAAVILLFLLTHTSNYSSQEIAEKAALSFSAAIPVEDVHQIILNYLDDCWEFIPPECQTRQIIRNVQLPIKNTTWSVNGRYVALWSPYDSRITIEDLDDYHEILQAGNYNGVGDVLFSPNGNLIVGSYGTITIWNLNNNNKWEVLQTLKTNGSVSLALSPDGHYLAASINNGAEISLWKYKDNKWQDREILGTDKDERDGGISFSPDGYSLVVGMHGIRIYRFEQNKWIEKKLLSSNYQAEKLVFSSDGRYLASYKYTNNYTVNAVWKNQKLELLNALQLLKNKKIGFWQKINNYWNVSHMINKSAYGVMSFVYKFLYF
jgi:WD40 repeat protein